ncbi:MAG: hypothetical protein Ta2G_11520 [Termitinemataceae bacterium]|nr:MAG: hypothetical protein Ta2G_11520 [Termitinemataceae bacterium]
MFENIIGQMVTQQLTADILHQRIAPSILFEGPPLSGKCTAALEAARILSCETETAPWSCTCPSCAHHKVLSSSDLMLMGPKNFSAQIAAAKDSFLRDMSKQSTQTFFYREIKKLLLRFASELINDDPKIAKLNPLLEEINKESEELFFLARSKININGEKDIKLIEKLSTKLTDNLIKLENEGISPSIPVSQIRNASYWLHLSPTGKKKVLIIENADKMKDEARNSLLKILEEPPATAEIILTTENSASLLPTILSRLRQYSFSSRSLQAEGEIIRRVFKGENSSSLASYLDNFLSLPNATLLPSSAFFWAAISNNYLKTPQINERLLIKDEILLIHKYCIDAIKDDPLFSNALPDCNQQSACSLILKASSNFEQRNSFTVFLKLLCLTLSKSLAQSKCTSASVALRSLTIKSTENALFAKNIYNQSPSLVLETLFYSLFNDIHNIF